MRELIEQFIRQIEEDQGFSSNTKASYRSDLNDFMDYVILTNSQLSDVNQTWVKKFLKHLEEINNERNSFNRRASTFRIFLRFLYKLKLLPTNYSLIVNNRTSFFKTSEDNSQIEDIKKLIEDTKLKIDQRLILLFVGRLGLTGTEIVSLRTFQVDFEKRIINLSDTGVLELPHQIFSLLREYLLEVRANLPGASENLSLFLNENGSSISEADIYKLIKRLGEDLNVQGKLTTRNLKRSLEDKNDILSMQREIYSVIAPS